jgi:hypothetical protein
MIEIETMVYLYKINTKNIPEFQNFIFVSLMLKSEP